MQARRILGLTVVILAMGAALALHFSQSSAALPGKPGDGNDERIAADAATGVNWRVNGRTNDSKHVSPLKQINASNVANLGLAWYLDDDGAMGAVSESTVVDGVIDGRAPPAHAAGAASPAAERSILMGSNGSDDAVRGALAA